MSEQCRAAAIFYQKVASVPTFSVDVSPPGSIAMMHGPGFETVKHRCRGVVGHYPDSEHWIIDPDTAKIRHFQGHGY